MQLLDNGYYLISGIMAGKLARAAKGGGGLPRHGYEKLVQHQGKNWFLGRLFHDGKQVWTIRETAWRLAGVGMVLGSKS